MTLPSLETLPDEINVASYLDEDTLHKIGERVKLDFDEDEMSRQDWLKRLNRAMKLAGQILEIKNYPWPNASNVKYPLMSIAALQFHARAYPMLIPSQNVVMSRVLGKDTDGTKAQKAERVQLHMNYQILDSKSNWEQSMDRLLLTLPITGSEFKKVYYDPTKGENCAEHVLAKDLVIHYYAKSVEEAARKTEILHLTKNQLLERMRAGLYIDCSHKLGEGEEYRNETTDVDNKLQGAKAPKVDDDTPHTVLEWHGFLDLDQDGYKEPYVVTILYKTAKVLRIAARFQPDSIEFNGDKVVKIIPDEYYTQYNFIPSPDGGVYGMGFGTLLGPLNEAVNTLINLLVDAGTISNLQSGFISKGIRMAAGSQMFKPGEWKQVQATGAALKDGIFPLPVRDPSTVLFQLLGTLITAGERLTSTTDMMVGENPGQNQKATTTMAVLDQGQKVFTAIYKRIRASMTKEFKQFYKLNSIYLDASTYVTFLNQTTGFMESKEILKEDYNDKDIVIIPTADPNAISQLQKVQKAQALLELLPAGVLEPKPVVRRYLEALEIENIDEVLPPDHPTSMELMAAEQQQLAMQQQGFENELSAREQTRKERETAINEEKAAVEALDMGIQALKGGGSSANK